MVEVSKEFYCHLCDYKTTNCTNWLKHVKTQKHLQKNQRFFCKYYFIKKNL